MLIKYNLTFLRNLSFCANKKGFVMARVKFLKKKGQSLYKAVYF